MAVVGLGALHHDLSGVLEGSEGGGGEGGEGE